MPYATRLKHWELERDVGIYTYPGGTHSISELWAPSMSPGGAGSADTFLARNGICSSAAAPMPLRLLSLWVNLCCAILARKAAVHQIFKNHSWVSFYHSVHHSMPRKHNSPLLLFSDFAVMIVDQVLHFFNCGARKPSFGHITHIQRKAHVGLF